MRRPNRREARAIAAVYGIAGLLALALFIVAIATQGAPRALLLIPLGAFIGAAHWLFVTQGRDQRR